MTPTPHGQVPEALIDLIDAYAETRHRYGGIYNAKTEAARNAVIAALSGVQALSAAPAVPAGWKAVPVNPTPEMWKAAKTVPDPNPPYPPHYGLVWDAMLATTPTPPAEQQAAPKAAPGGLSADSLRHQNKLLAETLGACILASGIVRKDIDGFTGPELLHFGGDLRSMLEVAPKQEVQEPTQEMVDAVMSLVDLEVSDPEDHRYDDGSKLAAQICRAVLALAPQQEAQEPVAWLVTWAGGEHNYVQAHASELPAVDQGRRMAGTVTPLYTAPQPAPHLPERDASLPAERQGLFRKFVVGRVDGSDKPGGKHHGCTYFVLDVDHDPCARPALAAYAAACESTHPTLAADLRTKWGVVPAPQPAPAPVAPDFYTACAWYESGGEAGWIPLPGYSNETEHGVRHLVLEAARKEGYKGTAAGRLLELGWEIRPVYLTPQPAPAQAVAGSADG